MSGFKTISDVRRANREAGQHFFDRDTMRHFQTRIMSGLYAGRFFITRERWQSDPYTYSVREALPNGTVRTPDVPFAGRKVSMLHFLEDARDACRKLAAATREVRK